MDYTYTYKGFSLFQEEEQDDDVCKIWHTVTLPDGCKLTLDHSPYEFISVEGFGLYVEFYLANGHFPNRGTIKSRGPLYEEDVKGLF